MPLTTQEIGVLLHMPELAEADGRALLAKTAFAEQWARDRLGGIAQGDASRSAHGPLIEQTFWLGARCAQGDSFAQKEAFGPKGALSLAVARERASEQANPFAPDFLDDDFVDAVTEKWVCRTGNESDGEWIEIRKPKSKKKALSEADHKLRAKRLREELAHVFSRGFMAACQDAMGRPDWLASAGRGAHDLEKTAKQWFAMVGWRGLGNLKAHCLEWALGMAVACDAPELGILALDLGASVNAQWAYQALFERRSAMRSMADIAVSRAIEREFLGLNPEPAWTMSAALTARGNALSEPNAIGLRVALAERLAQSAKQWESESAPRRGLPAASALFLAEKTRRVNKCLAAFEAADQNAAVFFARFDAEAGRSACSLASPTPDPSGEIRQTEAFEAALGAVIAPTAVALRACEGLDSQSAEAALEKFAQKWAAQTHEAYPSLRRVDLLGEEPELAPLISKQLKNSARLALALVEKKFLSENILREGVAEAVPAYMNGQEDAVLEKMRSQMAREAALLLTTAIHEAIAGQSQKVAASPSAKTLGRRRI